MRKRASVPLSKRGLIATAAALSVLLIVPAITSSAGPNPPGNNGTIKVDGVAFDDAPNNEPHVGCTFQIDFYGFDEGDLFADVTFESHPPTGPTIVLLTDTVFIGEDDNSGGGSEAGLDASETYTLDFTGITPHPNQGFHVKLTVHADGSQGADTKHKVFWVSGCPTTTTTTTTTKPPTTTTKTTTTATKTTTTATKTTTTASKTTTTASKTPTATTKTTTTATKTTTTASKTTTTASKTPTATTKTTTYATNTAGFSGGGPGLLLVGLGSLFLITLVLRLTLGRERSD